MSGKLTGKYSVQQFAFWAAYCGIYTFAATYLAEKGFSSAQTGWMLFSANFLSFILQPVIADCADRSKKNILVLTVVLLNALSLLCVSAVILLSMPKLLFSLAYVLAITCLDMQIPLLNALNVFFTGHSYKINYSFSRGLGAFSFAIISLLLGYATDYFGTICIPVCTLVFIVFNIAVTVSFPRIEKSGDDRLTESAGSSVSLLRFFTKYGWYCISLFGVLFLAMFHVMTENYLIEIIRRLGGDSSNLGLALFIATLVETPAMMLFDRVYRRTGSYKVLITSGVFFLLKAILFVLACSVTAIYFIQLLQVLTYVMLSPVQMYYAKECTDSADMIKGQSVITAAYALGCALGNLIGGNIISAYGVPAMLYCGVLMTGSGLIVLLLTVPRALKAHISAADTPNIPN